MGYKPESRAALKAALLSNWIPLRPLAPDPLAGAPEAELDEAFLNRLAKSLPAAPREPTAAGPSPYRPNVGRAVNLNVVCAAGEVRAVSHGPIAAPWQLVSLAFTTGAPPTGEGATVTATQIDATGLWTAPFGDFLLFGHSHAAGFGNVEPWAGSGTFGMPAINGVGRIMSPGTYLTGWGYFAAGGTVRVTAQLLEYIYAEVDPAVVTKPLPTYSYRYQVRPLPPPRQAAPETPRGFVISAGGFSRRIPLELLDPVLLREYVVNQENGRQTPGMIPYYG